MSFRTRLTLFFVLIVLVPMASVAILMFRLLSEVETARVDAAVAEQGQTVANLYSQAVEDAKNAVPSRSGSDLQLNQAVRERKCPAARERLQELVEGRKIARVGLVDQSGLVCVSGPPDALAPATIELPGGKSVPKLQVSMIRAAGFASDVEPLVGVPPRPTQPSGPGLAVCINKRLEYTSVEGIGDCPLPKRATVEDPQGRALLVRSLDATKKRFGSKQVVLSTLTGPDDLPEDARTENANRLVVAVILAGFFLLALVFALAVSRQLQQQVAGLLEAVRRLGRGDFSTRAPSEGGDEFAALGGEFNKMSDQLSARLDEVTRERERVLIAVRRLGAAVGANLDRGRLLDIAVTTAVEGVGAHGGRVSIRRTGDSPIEQAACAGSLGGLEAVLHKVEERVLDSGAFAEAAFGAHSALAHPLTDGEGDERHVPGVISVARAGDRFSDADRELLRYLAGQAALALENLDLHETVARESVTDGLTGLSNRRRFNEVMPQEVERWRRTGDPVALVLLDIDDFKAVNSTWGLEGGDDVLRAVGRLLRERPRGIDEPARYGGEEFPVVLPGTDLDGAYRLAEHLRTQIEKLEVVAVDDGGPIRVTVSAGVSSLPECARDEHGLMATADAALREAKRAGKNRTVRAPRGS
ncbi:MAG TPA: diguanylate cyclase [Solirubrobacteraceae bacterium]|nr:diguanylate cyclase [Solirubrobacteraceae bacterium]